MGLVHRPNSDGRQYFAVCLNVTEQERVVGHHHVRPCRTTTGAVDQALVRKERAEPARALARAGGEARAVDAPPADAECVEVALGRLARVGVDDRDGGKRVRRVAVGLDGSGAAPQALELAQAGVVVVPLESRVGKAIVELARQARQLVEHELVGKVVRFGGNTHGDVVALGGERERDQVAN